jgi:hypothetical protein
MNITVTRKWYSDKSTIGELVMDGFQCFTLEDAEHSEKISGETAIPAGEYEVRMTYSPRFKQAMPILLDVHGFEGVRIHWGNTADDTEGCLLLGTTRGPDFIGNSREAWNSFMVAMRKGVSGVEPQVYLTIEDEK